MNALFSYFFIARPGDHLSSSIRMSDCFCPHRPHITALTGLVGTQVGLSENQLVCRCGEAFRDAGAFALLPGEERPGEVHTFALTASDGARTYGFCRKWLSPPDPTKGHVQPLVACILSSHFWPGVFQEVLVVLEALLLAPLEATVSETGPSGWLAPQSPASQFLEALLETKLPEPGELFSVRKVISKKQLKPPPPEKRPPPLHFMDSSPEIVPGGGGEGVTWNEKLPEPHCSESPSAVLDTFDPNNPFDPPSYPADPLSPSRAESTYYSEPPPSDQSQTDPPSPSSVSSFSSFHSSGLSLPSLEDSETPLRRDESENRASETSASGTPEGWELVYTFERPWDVEGDPFVDASLEPFLRVVSPQVLVALLAALLRERRVAVVGPSIDDVSSIVFAAAAVLHPFQWQHIFLPVLPEPFLHYLSAPMPFLVGVQSSTWQKLQSQDIPLDDIVVLDLGLGTFQTPFPDRKDLPKDPSASLESDLRTAYSHLSPDAVRASFLRFFLSLFGWYRRFIRFDQNGQGAHSPFGGPSATCHLWFDHRTFVESVRDRKTAGFLNAFQGSQMYEAFVREVLARAAHCQSGEDPFSTEVRRLYDQCP